MITLDNSLSVSIVAEVVVTRGDPCASEDLLQSIAKQKLHLLFRS